MKGRLDEEKKFSFWIIIFLARAENISIANAPVENFLFLEKVLPCLYVCVHFKDVRKRSSGANKIKNFW